MFSRFFSCLSEPVLCKQKTLLKKQQGFIAGKQLRLSRGTDGAGIRAGAALDAGIRVDRVFSVALGNRSDRAFRRARAAGDALIRNLICHNEPSILLRPYMGL